MSNGLRSDYVKRIASLCLPNKVYVLPCDFFAKLKETKSDDSFILNLDQSNQQGSHYVGVLKSKNNSVLFFDPLGLPLLNSDIENALLNDGVKEILYSKKNIQGGISFHCGFFVLAFHIICAAQKKSMEEFISLFTDFDFKQNEEIATKIIVQQLKDM